MDTTNKQAEVIEFLALQEEAISRLYRVYAGLSAKYKDFWIELAKEETNHANWIRDLGIKTKEGKIYFSGERFRAGAIKASTAYIESQAIAADRDDFTEISALAMSYALEEALLEKKFFEIFESDAAELKHLLKELSDSTTQHRQRVKAALDAERAVN